jgi:hypothetical protein
MRANFGEIVVSPHGPLWDQCGYNFDKWRSVALRYINRAP